MPKSMTAKSDIAPASTPSVLLGDEKRAEIIKLLQTIGRNLDEAIRILEKEGDA